MSSSITLNSNLASLNAQRRLADSSRGLSASFVRLSSGLRINRASDDAAGLAISESLKTDQRVLAQGIRNINDGVSLLSIADAAVAELSSITIRLSELAEQAATGSLSNVQRAALDEEGQTLREEYFRIVQTTKFNGEKLFDGNLGELRLQAGYGDNGGISSGLGGVLGTGEFEAAIVTGIGDALSVTATADMDGDGNLDVVIADASDDAVYVTFGDGEGSFSNEIALDMGIGPGQLSLADINADGAMDIVSASPTEDSVFISLNDGSGNFSSPVEVISGLGAAEALAVGDFDKDGFVDIAINDDTANETRVYKGSGNGDFTEAYSVAITASYTDLLVADHDGDGNDDLIVAGQTSVFVALGDGAGGFATAVATAAKSQITSVSSGDFNDDGILDLFVQSGPAGNTEIFLGDADGSYETSDFIRSYLEPVAAGDFNGDGHQDLAAIDEVNDDVRIYEGDGTGEFSANGVVINVSGITPGILLDDFNRDGVLDILVSDGGDDELEVFLGETREGIAPLLDFSLRTQADARQALPVFRDKLNQLAEQRGQIGAYEARLSAALATTKVSSENYTSAASQITDADVAVEAARLVRQQILQQSGIAVLSQANQAPALALALLS